MATLKDILKEIPKFYWFIIVIYLSFMILRQFTWYPTDNTVEQKIEEAIKIETGLDIDLTP